MKPASPAVSRRQPEPAPAVITISAITEPTLAGHGPVTGQPTILIHTGNCSSNCQWCDSADEADWIQLTPELLFDRVCELSRGYPLLVTICCSEPDKMPLDELIIRGKEIGYTFALETEGRMHPQWFTLLDHLIITPKPLSPRSNKIEKGHSFDLEACSIAAERNPALKLALKFTILNENDYQFARSFDLMQETRIEWVRTNPKVARPFPPIQIFLQPAPPAALPQRLTTDPDTLDYMREEILNRTAWLCERIRTDHWHTVRILPPLDVLMFGDKPGL